MGDTGAAHALLLLVAALESAISGDVIVIASFAQGCEVVAFEMLNSEAVVGRRGLRGAVAQHIEESAYLKLLSFDGHIALDWGMRPRPITKRR